MNQIDGSWRWLSAWGLVEFEGSGSEKKPVAIVGASRDLTEQKQAEDLQRLLLNELNHRIKKICHNSGNQRADIACDTRSAIGETSVGPSYSRIGASA